ncbi:MAG TPA: type II toxin-antitoxin system VapC family toxin [archaeon]|nr:type II toxin-antitoxin system VapC family toxin [archaeon]
MTSGTSRYVLDTHAWIEYFRGTKIGEKIREKIEGKNCITPTIVIAEIADKYSKENYKYFDSDMEFIETNSTVMELNRDVARAAGKLKQAVRKEYKTNFGLADAIVLATARSANAVVVTGDYHFKKLKNVEYIQ